MPSWFVAFTLIFILIVRKVFVFVDAHGSQVEDKLDVIFYGNKLLLLLPASALYITAPNTVNIDNIEL